MAEFPGELGSGLEDFCALDEGTLDAEFGAALDDGFDGLHHKACAHIHEPVVDITCGVGVLDAAFLTENDASGVNVMVDHERGDSCHPLPVDDCPVDRGCAAVLRQQGGVEVEGAELGHRPYLLGKHPESHDDEQVRFPGTQRLQEFWILQLHRLQDGDAVLDGELLDRTFVDLQAAS